MKTRYIYNGIETRGLWFTVQRKNGRCSQYVFRCPYRAAEHAMRASGVGRWPDLASRGVRVVSVWPDEFSP